MSISISPRLALVAALCSSLLALPAAEARERKTTVTNAQGQSATRNVSRSGGDVNASTTTANGQTLSTRTVDRSATGTTATTSGPQGNSATRETVKTDTGSSTTVTGPKGNSGAVTVTR